MKARVGSVTMGTVGLAGTILVTQHGMAHLRI
jgi:hypothetical protein